MIIRQIRDYFYKTNHKYLLKIEIKISVQMIIDVGLLLPSFLNIIHFLIFSEINHTNNVYQYNKQTKEREIRD